MNAERYKMRVLVGYGDKDKEHVLIELESVEGGIPPERRATVAMTLLAEAAIQVARRHHEHKGFWIIP